MQEYAKKIHGYNAEIVGISSDDAIQMSKSIRELGVKFLLISDTQRRIIKQYGVLHPKQGISRPAVFIIDKHGLVRYVKVGKDYRDRPPSHSLLQALAFL